MRSFLSGGSVLESAIEAERLVRAEQPVVRVARLDSCADPNESADAPQSAAATRQRLLRMIRHRSLRR
tara:strand:- start:1212 stop:1415 length:204 start_codon:yes stop_codon:yes gene_type:complete